MSHIRARRLPAMAALLATLLLAGCDTIVMNPSGVIAAQQATLIRVSTALMLLIIVPVILLTLFFAWRYRQSNTSAPYTPDWDHSTVLELVIWGAPLLIIIALGLITWTSTHLLDPYRPLQKVNAQGQNVPVAAKPLDVQVVALDWKWLFIYPEQGIATVNELVTPVDVPVRFSLTASTVMNSFYIPALAGQIYAMPGMSTSLHAVLDKPGQYEGFSANYSGAGFSNMRFRFRGVPQEEFNAWVGQVKKDGNALQKTDYLALEKPSERDQVRHYASVAPGLYDAVVNRCVEAGTTCMKDMMAADAMRNREPGRHGEQQPRQDAGQPVHAEGKEEESRQHEAMKKPEADGKPRPSGLEPAPNGATSGKTHDHHHE
ncbi:ubiquinol oxidase subunit II [Noviherbaspirillum galbum]|uniref:Ubiquinol oxidase subunit 2 n=1 Tax=Noviherbaspirillum galbum TaxID=2709383 RepID=A0A6B3SH59_9BURK|nr:ubiquinol oxidase subunit II [Noviherbaspirillum galbum]NEX59973.1 ubiquinol oxidase subunit II [Noviherbaspirillum galbum]